MKKIYIVVMLVVMSMLGGCAAISPNKTPSQITGTSDFAYRLAKNDSGILYGVVINSPLNKDITTVKFACDAIHNNDERCSHQDNYVVGKIYPRSQFIDGFATVVILMQKDKEIQACWNFASKEYCTYVKVQTEKGKLGTVLEIVSRPGEEICFWRGGLVGGVVCPSLGWDSAKEIRGFSAPGYALKGVDK